MSASGELERAIADAAKMGTPRTLTDWANCLDHSAKVAGLWRDSALEHRHTSVTLATASAQEAIRVAYADLAVAMRGSAALADAERDALAAEVKRLKAELDALRVRTFFGENLADLLARECEAAAEDSGDAAEFAEGFSEDIAALRKRRAAGGEWPLCLAADEDEVTT